MTWPPVPSESPAPSESRRAAWLAELPTLAAVLAHVPLILYGWSRLPEKVPLHWNWQGEVDRYGSRFEALILLPLLLLLPLVLMYAVQGEGGGRNKLVLRVVRLGMALLSLALTAQAALELDAGRALLIGVGAMFTLLGNVMGKAQPSTTLGLRTRWTFLSRRAWHRGQRRGGLLFFGLGLTSLVCGLAAPSSWAITPLLPLLIGMAVLLGSLGLTYLSYLDYRNDPDPQPVQVDPA